MKLEEKKSAQTGMEKTWERWILESLNVLMQFSVEVYKKDSKGNRLSNTPMALPDRISALGNSYVSVMNRSRSLELSLAKEERERGSTERKKQEAVDLLRRVFESGVHQNGTSQNSEVASDLEDYASEHFPEMFEEENCVE